jgi:hypothetical protein
MQRDIVDPGDGERIGEDDDPNARRRVVARAAAGARISWRGACDGHL